MAAPDAVTAAEAARLVASGQHREAAELLGVQPGHLRRTIDRALRTGEQQHQASAARLRALRTELAGDSRETGVERTISAGHGRGERRG